MSCPYPHRPILGLVKAVSAVHISLLGPEIRKCRAGPVVPCGFPRSDTCRRALAESRRPPTAATRRHEAPPARPTTNRPLRALPRRIGKTAWHLCYRPLVFLGREVHAGGTAQGQTAVDIRGEDGIVAAGRKNSIVLGFAQEHRRGKECQDLGPVVPSIRPPNRRRAPLDRLTRQVGA